jgi:MYXO-CTERM domain-containing protein
MVSRRFHFWRCASVAVLSLAAFTRTARAGCPNVCELTVGAITVVPPLDCVTVEATAQTCDCGVFVSLNNGCTTPVDAVGFTFTSCGPPGANAGSLTQPCPVVEPNMLATVPLRTTGTGMKQWALQLQNEGTDFSVTIPANVTSSGASGGCAIARSPAPASRPTVALLALFGFLAAWARRIRSRKPLSFEIR